jgi:Metallopeptidase toxin 4
MLNIDTIFDDENKDALAGLEAGSAEILGRLGESGVSMSNAALESIRSFNQPGNTVSTILNEAASKYEWKTYWSNELRDVFFGGFQNRVSEPDDPIEVTDETEIYNSLKPYREAILYADNNFDNKYNKGDTYKFDIKVFISADGAKLLRAWKGAQPKPNELLIFLENNEGDTASTGQLLVRAGTDVETKIKDSAGNKNIYNWINSIYKISPDALKELLKSAGSKGFFVRVFKKILNLAARIIVLPIKALAGAFSWVGRQIEKLKISEETWKADHTEDIKKWLGQTEDAVYKKLEQLFDEMPVEGTPAKKNFENKMPEVKQYLQLTFGALKEMLNKDIALVADVLFALLCGVINAIIDLVAGIFIFIGMLLNLVAEALKSEAELLSNLHYYNSLAMEYIDNFTQALKKVDWNKLMETAVKEYITFMYITLPSLLNNLTINPREVAYYIGYVGINIVICFIPIVDLVELTQIARLAKPLQELFEIIFNLVNKAGRAVVKTAGGILKLFEGFIEMLSKGTEEVINFVKKILAAIKGWLEELLGVRKKVAQLEEEELEKFRKIFDESDAQGGKLLSWKKIKKLRALLKENYDVDLEVVKKGTARWKRWTRNGTAVNQPRTVGSFVAGPPPVMYILEEVSELTVFHEMVHIKIWKALPAEKLAKLHIVEEEIMVWEEIWKSRSRWTNNELIASYKYVNEKVIYNANKAGENFRNIYVQEVEDLILNKNLGIQ